MVFGKKLKSKVFLSIFSMTGTKTFLGISHCLHRSCISQPLKLVYQRKLNISSTMHAIAFPTPFLIVLYQVTVRFFISVDLWNKILVIQDSINIRPKDSVEKVGYTCLNLIFVNDLVLDWILASFSTIAQC